MKISIDYESSWRNSFLDGSNNEPLPKKGRKFIGSMTSLKKPENFLKREITNDTVMGILNCLIGDQRKLYQSRQSEGYYFEDLEPKVSFVDNVKNINQEMTYIRNITGSTDKNSFTGAIKASDPMLSSEFSKELWGVLTLNLEQLREFILDRTYLVESEISLNPIDLIKLANSLDKDLKAVDLDKSYGDVIDVLNNQFAEIVTEKQKTPYVENNGKVKPVRLYAAALYIQLDRLKERFDMSLAVTKAGKIAGFSKRGFNGQRDFMKNFVTGGAKLVWGNPYIAEEFVKGEGKTKHLMKKASGQLEIKLDINRAKAKELETLIKNAGVSSFYLGKKGLAYVSKIRV